VYVNVPRSCKACEARYQKGYNAIHYSTKERSLRHHREWADPEKRAKTLAAFKTNSFKAARSRYYRTEKSKARIQRYYETEKGQTYLIAKWARHSRKRQTAFNTLTAQEWRAIKAGYQGHCAYCDRNDLPLTLDHIYPIAHGGTNTANNVTAACWPCNMKKRDHTTGWIPNEPRGSRQQSCLLDSMSP